MGVTKYWWVCVCMCEGGCHCFCNVSVFPKLLPVAGYSCTCSFFCITHTLLSAPGLLRYSSFLYFHPCLLLCLLVFFAFSWWGLILPARLCLSSRPSGALSCRVLSQTWSALSLSLRCGSGSLWTCCCTESKAWQGPPPLLDADHWLDMLGASYYKY